MRCVDDKVRYNMENKDSFMGCVYASPEQMSGNMREDNFDDYPYNYSEDDSLQINTVYGGDNAKVLCPYCRKILPADSNFCMYCGKRLR